MLADYIERTMKYVKTFVASDPASISSGGNWFQEILENLSKADALVVIYSRNARNRMWVGFEIGYVWNKLDGDNIHCVHDPRTTLPSPLNAKQAKDFTDVASMAVFFKGLANDIGSQYEVDQYRITELIDSLPKYDSFAKWKSLLQNSQWTNQELSGAHDNITVWTSVEDPVYQIENSYEVENERLDEPWVKGFPDPHVAIYIVNLKVSGQIVKQERFVSLDGGRYFVPLPNVETNDEVSESAELTYCYRRTSLCYLLGNVIGRYYYLKNLDNFARHKGIAII
jgi:hypothetical protein